MNNRKWPLTLFLILLSPLFTLGNGYATGLDDLQQLLSEMEEGDDFQLLGIMEEETTIATRSKLNADYVPGMITILRGEVMHARGATTVAEALAFVPGIEQSRDRIGNQVALVRGIGGSFASGNMKILLDDVSINAALSALADPVLQMPIEQVDRIEVIRGPGSALYGEYAYAGVINVVTRKDKSQAFIGGGSFNTRFIGGVFSRESQQSGVKFSLNLARWLRDDTGTRAGEDVLHNTAVPQESISKAPGIINDEADYKAALFNLNYRDFTLQVQLLDNGRGDYFGTLDALPGPDDGIAYQNKHQNLNLSQLFTFSHLLSVQFKLGWQRYDNSFDITILPAGYGPYPYTNGFLANGFYREQQLNSGIDLHWRGWQNHNLLVSISLKEIKVKDAWRKSNVDLASPVLPPLPSMQRFTGAENWVDENKKRTIRSLVLQDEYRYSDQTTYTLGVRYDHYKDTGYNTSPRLAGVFRYSNEHIFKIQYAHAFRPPTFYELWNTKARSLQPETIRTLELAYIHRLWNRVDRITLFHSRLSNLIVSEELLNFGNLRDAKLSGIEAETEQYLSEWIKLNANISYSKATDQNTNDPIAGAAKWLGTIGVMMEPNSSVTCSLDLHYVGSREREANDPRSNLSGYHTINTTLTYAVPNSRVTLRAGIKNLLDKETRYPAPVSYMDDYPQPGRNGWVQASYDF